MTHVRNITGDVLTQDCEVGEESEQVPKKIEAVDLMNTFKYFNKNLLVCTFVTSSHQNFTYVRTKLLRLKYILFTMHSSC